MEIKELIRKIGVVILLFPMMVIILEIGIRIAVPQPIGDVTYEDVYTERFSPALNANVKSLVPGITRELNGAVVQINENGCRDFIYTKTKNDLVTRIAIVGSSVAFGFKLKLEDTFAKRLEQKLNRYQKERKYEVLLFGRPGFRAKEAFACVKDEILDYDPDLVIYSFVQNNYENNSVEEFFANQTRLKTISKPGVKKPESLLRKIRNNWWKIRNKDSVKYFRSHFHFYLFTVNSISSLLRELSPIEKEKAQNIAPLFPDEPDFKNKIKNTETWISLIHEECMKRNVAFCLLMHPYEIQVFEESVEKWKAKGIRIPDDVLRGKTIEIMKQYSDNDDFLFIDVTPMLRIHADKWDELFLPGDYGHYSSFGHEQIADKLTDELKDLFVKNSIGN